MVESMLGPEEHEDEWFVGIGPKPVGIGRRSEDDHDDDSQPISPPVEGLSPSLSGASVGSCLTALTSTSSLANESGGGINNVNANGRVTSGLSAAVALEKKRKVSTVKLPFDKEKEKVQVLDGAGDICGGKGGELGRRLEAWLTVTGHEDGRGTTTAAPANHGSNGNAVAGVGISQIDPDKAHTTSVAYSPDDHHIISGSGDKPRSDGVTVQ